MYSVVILAAMTGGVEAPGFGSSYGSKFWTNHCFFEDCWPARYGWTCGPGRGGYYPTGYSSCAGCYGYSSCHGCWSSCSGCWSSCHGYSTCHGCWGTCHGYSSCRGCCGGLGYMWSTCHGCAGAAIYGCYGSLPNMFNPGAGYAGCQGTGNFGMYGLAPAPINPETLDPRGLSYNPNYSAAPAQTAPNYITPNGPAYMTPNAPASTLSPPVPLAPIAPELAPRPVSPIERVTPVVPQPKKNDVSAPSNNEKLMSDSKNAPHQLSGSMVIRIPSQAKLYVDGNLVKDSQSTERRFHSPALDRDESYYYMVKVEALKDGKLVSDEKKVRIRAGETTKVSFESLTGVEKDFSSVADAK